MVISGVVQYEDRAPSPGLLGPVNPLAVRGANIWVLVDADSSVVTRAVTSDDGSYSLRFEPPAGAQVRVVVGTSSQVATRPIRVVRLDSGTHGLSSAAFTPAAKLTLNLTATEASGLGQAFNVFDTLVFGMDKIRSYGVATPVPMSAMWESDSTSTSFFTTTTNQISLAANDGYNDVVILHEFGHYHQTHYGATNNPGGAHPTPGGDNPLLAWGEGQATYLAIAFRGIPYYIEANPVDGGWYVELEQRVDPAQPTLGMDQLLSEWMVAEFLWDVGDSPSQDKDADPVHSKHDNAIAVTTTYLHPRTFVDRGVAGVDLNDWLDGWFSLFGPSWCPQFRQLTSKYGFPYDFSGPVGCP
jgi:hypothetical protein